MSFGYDAGAGLGSGELASGSNVTRMFLTFGLIINACLLVAGLWWCKVVWERRHSDLAEFKESDDMVKRGVIVFFWLVTVLIANFLWALISSLLDSFG